MTDNAILQRQRELVMIFQDEISLALREKRDTVHISALVSSFRVVVSMLDEMSATTTPNKENTKKRQEEYERGVQQQYRLQQQEVRQVPPPTPTKYAYNDGFQGVTLPQHQASKQKQPQDYEPYRTEDKEYWEDE
jgi:hypothetical protein